MIMMRWPPTAALINGGPGLPQPLPGAIVGRIPMALLPLPAAHQHFATVPMMMTTPAVGPGIGLGALDGRTVGRSLSLLPAAHQRGIGLISASPKVPMKFRFKFPRLEMDPMVRMQCRIKFPCLEKPMDAMVPTKCRLKFPRRRSLRRTARGPRGSA